MIDPLARPGNGRPGNGLVKAAAKAMDPVFVLCMGRSGSTLLRFMLDAHPELADVATTSARIAMLSELLGLTPRPMAGESRHDRSSAGAMAALAGPR